MLVPANEALLWLVLFIALVIVYTGFKVRKLMQKSDEQWRAVDQSKLREWQDDD